jgi:hypothetical protein
MFFKMPINGAKNYAKDSDLYIIFAEKKSIKLSI